MRSFFTAATLICCISGATAAADPVATFETIVKRCEASLNAQPRERVRQLANGEWARNFTNDIKVSYDVKKTDSLVSPLLGLIRVQFNDQTVRRRTEDEVRAADLESGSSSIIDYELRYALQKGAWTLTDGSTQAKLRMAGEKIFTDPLGHPVALQRADLFKAQTLSSCME